MTPVEVRRDAALRMANDKRRRVAYRKADLRTGRLSIAEVMSEPPAELRYALLIDLIRWSHSSRNKRSLIEIGRRAVRDGVNLLVPLGEASARSRAWVAEHGSHFWRPSL